MDSQPSAVLSKSAKKNKKKKQKKAAAASSSSEDRDDGCSKPLTAADLVPVLKQQLDDAKASKDHDLAAKLRMQLWVVADLAKGVKTDMDEEEYAKVVASLPLYKSSSQDSTSDSRDSGHGTQQGCAIAASGCSTENRIRSLRKKLDQIVELKAKKAKGVALERNQIEKINNESSIRMELEELQNVMKDLHVS